MLDRYAHTSNVRSVVASPFLTQRADLGNLLFRKLDLFEVVTDTRWSNRLGDDTVATDLGPRKTDDK